MATILGKVGQGYNILFDELTDPRTNGWFLIAKPYQCLTLLGLYLMFVLKWGPKWMKNRQPFNLDKILIVYNALQVVSCLYLFITALNLAWGWDYKWICEPVDYSNTPKAIAIAELCYFYFLMKVVDLLDTVFFVLRKKKNQVSFLHIYHHTGMVMLIWGAVTYLPGGHATLIGVINSFVHIVMYSYYLLTVAYPSVKNAIWLKKHVTQLQILQFFWCVVHMGALVFKTDCEFPRWVSAVFLPQNLFMLILFIDFYIKSYVIKPKVKSPVNGIKNDTVSKIGTEKSENSYKLNGKTAFIEENYNKNDFTSIINENVDEGNNVNAYSENLKNRKESGKTL